MEEIKRILVVSRSTQYCRFAVECGISLARKFGAELSIMHLISNPVDLEAVNVPDIFKPNDVQNYRSLQDEVKQRIDKIISTELQPDFPIKSMVKDGTPADEVEKEDSVAGIDLLVLLAH
jgi:nucleotide-binding universal stress UspA family protein